MPPRAKATLVSRSEKPAAPMVPIFADPLREMGELVLMAIQTSVSTPMTSPRKVTENPAGTM